MKTRKKQAGRTRENLLAAAGAVFAEKGYRDATVADICRRAGANVAAVNYHFRSKQELYAAAWRHAFLESIKAYDPAGGVPENAPPEERLRGRITALLRRISDKNNIEFLIVHKEMANPTGLLRKLQRDLLEPLRRSTEVIVREILGPRATARQVRFSLLSIISQCINPMVRGHGGRPGHKPGGPPADFSLEAYAEHVVRFSLGGLAGIKRGGGRIPS